MALRGDITQLQDQMMANMGAMQGSSIPDAVADLQTRMTAVEAQLADHETRIAALEGAAPLAASESHGHGKRKG